MKKIFYTLLIALTSSISFAQETKMEDKMTVEQRNELHLKKMTIDLDLNENQQKEMAKIIAENSKKREEQQAKMKAHKESGKKLSAQERFELKSKILDEQKAHKDKMRKLLNNTQFDKWEKNQKEKRYKKHLLQKQRKSNKKQKTNNNLDD